MPPRNRSPYQYKQQSNKQQSTRPRSHRPVRISTDKRPLVPDDLNGDSVPVARVGASTIFPGLFRKRLQYVPPEVLPGDLVAVDVGDSERLGYGFYTPAS